MTPVPHQLRFFNRLPFISLKPLKIKFHYFVNVLHDLKSMSKLALPFLEHLLSMIYASNEQSSLYSSWLKIAVPGP